MPIPHSEQNLLKRLSYKAGAALSEDGRYRYDLFRHWDKEVPGVVFIMLNPSTADAMKDDQTVRVCTSFAKKWGKGGIYILNLFALRSSTPILMMKDPDPVGPENDRFLEKLVGSGPQTIVAAWSSHGSFQSRGPIVKHMLRSLPLLHLGLNKDGSPKHPLRVPLETSPTPW